jgi:hypothetical protein
VQIFSREPKQEKRNVGWHAIRLISPAEIRVPREEQIQTTRAILGCVSNELLYFWSKRGYKKSKFSCQLCTEIEERLSRPWEGVSIQDLRGNSGMQNSTERSF